MAGTEKVSITTITPEQATKWLETCNTHNRPVKDATVDLYALDMKRGKWLTNGESIVFDRNGVLMDGQHRLWACVESKTPFTTVLVV